MRTIRILLNIRHETKNSILFIYLFLPFCLSVCLSVFRSFYPSLFLSFSFFRSFLHSVFLSYSFFHPVCDVFSVGAFGADWTQRVLSEVMFPHTPILESKGSGSSCNDNLKVPLISCEFFQVALNGTHLTYARTSLL